MIEIFGHLLAFVFLLGCAVVLLGDAAAYLPLAPRYPYRLALRLCLGVLALGGIFRLGEVPL